MANPLEERLRQLGIAMPPQGQVQSQGMGMQPWAGQQPAQLQSQPQDKKEWLRALLMGATLFGGMAGREKPEKKPPGGYQKPEKPLMAQAFSSLAQGIEKRAQGEQMLKDAQTKQRQEQEKETFERQFKLYTEQMKPIMQARDIASREKIAGMRETVPEPTEMELEEHTKQMQILDDRSKLLQAQRARQWDLIKDNGEDDPQVKAHKHIDKLIKDTQAMNTVVGGQVRNNMLQAWNAVESNGFTDLSPLYQVQTSFTGAGMETYQRETLTETDEGEKIATTTLPAKDYSNNITLIEGMIRSAEQLGAGKEISKQDGIAIQNAVNSGNEGELNRYIAIYGANQIDQFLSGN